MGFTKEAQPLQKTTAAELSFVGTALQLIGHLTALHIIGHLTGMGFMKEAQQ